MEQKFSNLFDQATSAARQNKTASNRRVWTPEFARFKMQFKYRDGTTSIPYHSYDIHKAKGGVNITDEQLGYSKLLLFAEKKRHEDRFLVGTIWANLTDDLRTFVDGRLNMNYDFIVFKIVRGQNAYASPFLQFNKGKLDVEFIKQNFYSKAV